MKFYVLSNELKAAQYFSSKDKARYVLLGVNIEAKKDRAPVITATDGRRIITLKSQAVQEADTDVPDTGCSVTIEVECLNIIQKLFPGTARLTITATERSITVSCQDVGKYVDIEFTHRRGRTEGEYPKFRMVIPRKGVKRTPVDSIAINPGLVACLDNVRKALHLPEHGIHLQFIDAHSVTVIKFSGCNYVWAGIMPMRDYNENIELWEPDFLELPASLAAPSESGVHA